MGRIPVLEDGQVRIYESGAIVQYLLARYGDGKFSPNVEDPMFPEYLQWLHYAEGSIMGQVNILVVETILLPPEKRNDVNNRAKLLGVALGNVDSRLYIEIFDRHFFWSGYNDRPCLLWCYESRCRYFRNDEPKFLCQSFISWTSFRKGEISMIKQHNKTHKITCKRK